MPYVLYIYCSLLYFFFLSEKIFIKYNFLLFLFIITFLVSSRYVGLLWDGSDDMASYFLAYEHYTTFETVPAISLFYAKNVDILFAYYSYFLKVWNFNLFQYYFSTILITFIIMYFSYRKILTLKEAIFSVVFYILYIKSFQLQWHILRSSVALPILFMAIYYRSIDETIAKKSLLIYVIGATIHMSSALLLLPLFIFAKNLRTHINFIKYIKIILKILFVSIILFLILTLTDNYVVNKITGSFDTRSFFQINSNIIYLILPLFLMVTYVIVFKKLNLTNYFIYNIILYNLLLIIVGVVIAGGEIFRIVQFTLFLQPIVFLMILQNIKNLSIKIIFSIPIILSLYLGHLYIVNLNQSKFFYKSNQAPINLTVYQTFPLLIEYLENDIQYFNGYRYKEKH
ncbi:EpsG family protein [Malaciobacter pacificus]|nr:EpsG family protein [Malaciobacter pacificus]